MVAMAVVEDIVSGGLSPGDRLPTEAAMLERFRVGRASIREGLRLLENYGVISIRPGQNGGPVVAELDSDDLGRTLALYFRLKGATNRDLIDARLVIEPVMARLAAERQNQQQLDRIKLALEHEAAGRPPSAHEFHQAIAGASGNPVLDALGQSLRALYADRLHSRDLFPSEGNQALRHEHHEIGKAILAGDGARAERLMAAHMSDLAALQESRTPWFMDERVSWHS
jgi:DNA-binding FadR family transcriptional regulator